MLIRDSRAEALRSGRRGLTAPSSHTTVRTCRIRRFQSYVHLVIRGEQIDETLSAEPIRRHRLIRLGTESHAPPALAGRGQTSRLLRRHTQMTQPARHRAAPLALPKAEAAQLSPKPLLHPGQLGAEGCIAVVPEPSLQEDRDFLDHLRKLDTSVSSSELPNTLLRAS